MTPAKYRNAELIGLILVTGIVAGGLAIITARQTGAWLPISPGVWPLAGAFFIGHLINRFLAPRADQLLLPLCAFLAAVGWLELKALGSANTASQQIWIGLGVGAAALTLLVVRKPDSLREFKYLAGVVGIGLLLSPIFFGTIRGGSKLWLIVGGYSFQPAELAKIFLTVFLAAYLAEKKEVLAAGRRRFLALAWPPARQFGPLALMWMISLAVLVLERDLGSSLIFFSLFLVLIYVATGRAAFVVAGLGLFAVGAAGAYRLFSHVAARVDVWLQPLPPDISGSAYQVGQSLYALSAGGLTGAGLGAGLLGRRISMPAVHTDFIFSALGEELGLAGTAAIILAYLLFLGRGFQIAGGAKSDFTKLLASGLATVTALQAAVIIGGVIKFIPLTGVTLPFVSYGGSSIVASFIIAGLLLAVSREANG